MSIVIEKTSVVIEKMIIMRAVLFLLIPGSMVAISACTPKLGAGNAATRKKTHILNHLQATYTSDADRKPHDVPIWNNWVRKSGELPPDFGKLPSHALPQDLLTFDNGGAVLDSTQWPARKKEIKAVLDQYMLGRWPPAPPDLAVKYPDMPPEENELYLKKDVQLFFAPSVKAVEFAKANYRFNPYLKTSQYWNDHADFTTAVLNVELYLPKHGKPPYPVIIVPASGQETLRPQDVEKLKRGYAVVRYFRDADYLPAVYVDYECNQLEWCAFATSRCVDFLYKLYEVDHSRIAVAGHSRDGKIALLAAAMDKRINAVIVSHPGTGAGSFNLWRYAGDKFGGESLENSTRQFPYWNNPRMRFFIGRENKMPFDSHYLLSLVAPRPCLMGTGLHDKVGEVWGDQQCYLEVKKVYQLFGKEDQLGFYVSPGGHEETSDMTDKYLDWLDEQFGSNARSFTSRPAYTYSFEEWKKTSGQAVKEEDFQERSMNDILTAENGTRIVTSNQWEEKAEQVKNRIRWMTGDLLAYRPITGVVLKNKTSSTDELIKADLPIDTGLVAHLTYPNTGNKKIPVVIYLHAYLDAVGYDWSSGYGYLPAVGDRLAQNGFLAVEFDQFGYGTRNSECGIEFYQKNPSTSALGVMIQDVRKIIDALRLLDFVDTGRIMVSGYSLGGMVALYAAVFDPRISAVATTSGFASMRMDVHGEETEGLRRYFQLRPTLPRLGLFRENEKRIPYDFHEVLALIAPRPVFILAPKLDQDWVYTDVETCFREARKIFDLYHKRDNLALNSPDDFNRFPPEYQQKIIDWFKKIRW